MEKIDTFIENDSLSLSLLLLVQFNSIPGPIGSSGVGVGAVVGVGDMRDD